MISDLDALVAELGALDAVRTTPVTSGPTGRFYNVRYAGGTEVEYVEWTEDLTNRIVHGTPRGP